MNTLPDGASAPSDLHCFEITADLCPQALLRILGLVAQLTLIPRSVLCERHDDRLHARIAIDGLSPQRAEILLAKISMIVTVREAFISPS